MSGGVSPDGSGFRATHEADKSSSPKASIPNAEERVMIAALRAGKSDTQAFMEYCWAKCVVPIRWGRWTAKPSDPMNCRPNYHLSMAMAKASDAHAEGASDEEIATAFREGQDWDFENTELCYRAMKDDERPSAADIIRAMNLDDKMWLVERIGIRPVAHAVMGGDLTFAAKAMEAQRAETLGSVHDSASSEGGSPNA